jgi:hypothetical protein
VLNPFVFRLAGPLPRILRLISTGLGVIALTLIPAKASGAQDQVPFREQLKGSSFKIAHECYVDNNWEIFAMNADGSDPVNLTHTPKEHEHYPQASPDGSKICFSVDEGEGRFLVNGNVDVDEIAQRLNVQIDREGFETVGGYLLSHLGRVPAVGEKLEMDGLTVEVLDAERRRINKVRMCRKQSAAMDTEEAEVRSRSV